MTDVSGVDGATGASAPASSGAGFGELDGEAFLRLLVAQMQYQDPMAPADSTEMMQQTAMFSQVEALNTIAQQQQELIGFHQGQMAAGMVGREIAGVDADGERVAGVVESVRFTPDGPRLQVGGSELHLVDATEVHA